MSRNSPEIPPLIFIFIGLAVSISSIIINGMSESNFILFIIVGFIMFIYGVIKQVLRKNSVSESHPKKVKENINGNHKAHGLIQHQQHTHINPNNHNHHLQNHQNNQERPRINFCPHCGGRLPGNVNFCPHCGGRIF